MIDTVLNLMFRCSHRRLTRPVTPVSKAGVPHGETYVVCLDCGKQFAYDLQEMRVGKAIRRSTDSGVVPPQPLLASRSKMRFALLAAVPVAVMMALRPRKAGEKRQETGEKAGNADSGATSKPLG